MSSQIKLHWLIHCLYSNNSMLLRRWSQSVIYLWPFPLGTRVHLMGCGADGSRKGGSSVRWKWRWEHLVPQPYCCWCHCHTTALGMEWRMRGLGKRVWEEHCLWESRELETKASTCAAKCHPSSPPSFLLHSIFQSTSHETGAKPNESDQKENKACGTCYLC